MVLFPFILLQRKKGKKKVWKRRRGQRGWRNGSWVMRWWVYPWVLGIYKMGNECNGIYTMGNEYNEINWNVNINYNNLI